MLSVSCFHKASLALICISLISITKRKILINLTITLSYHYMHFTNVFNHTITLIVYLFSGDDGVKMLKDGEDKPNVPSSMIAEEAVDQLQASEKLIAGMKMFNKLIYYYI